MMNLIAERIRRRNLLGWSAEVAASHIEGEYVDSRAALRVAVNRCLLAGVSGTTEEINAALESHRKAKSRFEAAEEARKNNLIPERIMNLYAPKV